MEPVQLQLAVLSPPWQNLQQRWQSLLDQADESFFLSWPWISTWLKSYFDADYRSPYCSDARLHLLELSHQGRVVALAFACKNRRRSFKFLPVQQLLINQLGQQDLDQIWIEYNGLLCHKDYQEAAYKQLSPLLKQSEVKWDELIISGMKEALSPYFGENQGHQHIHWRAPTYKVNLTSLRTKQTSYLASLSRNTRYQIRRALKNWQTKAQLEVIPAQTSEQALSYLDWAGKQHIQRWGRQVSGFTNPHFCRFHRNLIQDHWSTHKIDLLAIKQQESLVAVLYNFIHEQKVYFYLSGIDFSVDAQLKPGLVSHSLAIEHYLKQGMHEYDFLGGDAQYKASLGEQGDSIAGFALQRPSSPLVLERCGRLLKNKIFLRQP